MLSSFNQGRIYSGECPQESCHSSILYSGTVAEVECWSCKTSCMTSSLINPTEIVDGSDALLTFWKVLTGIPVKPDPPVTKVLGLSTYHCKLLSPLLTLYGIDKAGRAKTIHELKNCATFDCSWLGDRGFTIEQDNISLPGYGQDSSGSVSYLSGTLSLLRSYNNDRDALVPLHVDGDGHCLVHAVSRAIVGRELFWHALRTGLKLHLTDNLPRYKELLNDFINSSEWEDIIAECDPDYAPSDNEMLGLRNIHIFGLANVLRRPILLVDSVAGMQSSGDYSALFVPGLIPPDQCVDRNGELNKPICLAWSSSGRNHYIPLVGIRGCDPPLFPRSLLPKVWGVSQSMVEDYIEFNKNECLAIGGGKLMQDSYLMKLASGMDALFHQKHGVDPSLVADTYYSNFVKAVFFGMELKRNDPIANESQPNSFPAFHTKPSEVLMATKTALQERRLACCLNCTSVNLLPLNSEWLRPHGLLYNIAKKECDGGVLLDNHKYTFSNYGVTCTYDARKDMLVVEKSARLDKCSWCESNRLRLIHFDGTVLYENGDLTKTPADVAKAKCKCGFKHWYNGREYDNPPEKITISFEWNSRKIVEDVLWFQDELDPSLNSNPHQIAAFIIHKHFPGERDTGTVRQKIQEILLSKTRTNTLSATQTRPVSVDPMNQGEPSTRRNTFTQSTLANHIALKGLDATSESTKPKQESQNVAAASKKRQSDSYGGALPKLRSVPASLAAAAAISRAEANQVEKKRESGAVAVSPKVQRKEEEKRQVVRLGPGYSVISEPTREARLIEQKMIENVMKSSKFLNYISSFGDPNDMFESRNAGKLSTNLTAPSTKVFSKRGENVMKSDPSYGSLSRIANLLNVGSDRSLSDCEDLMDSDDENSL